MHLRDADAVEPLFSIVTVCRNAAASIGRTVESVLAQTDCGGAAEHIVIDGVSVDDTLDVLARYAHLRVVSEPDSGIYDAMNKGAAMARGAYLGFLNADDWYEPDTLSAVADVFREFPRAGIVHGDVRRWRGDTAIDIVKPPHEAAARRTAAMPVNHPACFVRGDVFARSGGFDTSYRIFADYDWIVRLVNAGVELRYCPKVLTNFRVGGVSTVRFAIRERYRVLRSNGTGRLAASKLVGHACGAVMRNRWRQAHH